MQTYFCKTKIISGTGAIGALKDLNSRRFFLICDPFFEKNGMAKQILEAAGAEKTQIFSDVRPDPDVALAAQATARARDFDPDPVAALGGGSTMDCAKAVAYFLGKPVQLVAIPTTSGSGSEVTDFSILTHENTKHPLIDEKLLPHVAILDDSLLTKLPPSLIADSGFDVIAHALEAYVARGAGAITDALARDAFCTAYSLLLSSYRGNTAVRQQIHTASTMAGMAFSQAGLGLCHGLSHCLGGLFHLPHGRLNAILLPAVIGVNANAAGAKYASLCRSAGLSGGADTVAVRNLRNALIRLRRELGLPATLAEAGVDPREVWRNASQIAQTAMADPCCDTNPVKVEDFMIRRVLEEVTGRV